MTYRKVDETNKVLVFLVVALLWTQGCSNSTKTEYLHGSEGTTYEWLKGKEKVDTIREIDVTGKLEALVLVQKSSNVSFPFNPSGGFFEIAYDRLDCDLFCFHKNDSILTHLVFRHGLLHGTQSRFYDNGYLEVTSEYNKGRLEGYQYEYYTNGKLKRYGVYIGDTCVGGFIYNDSAGRVQKYIFSDSVGNTIYIRRYDTLGNVILEEGDSTLNRITR